MLLSIDQPYIYIIQLIKDAEIIKIPLDQIHDDINSGCLVVVDSYSINRANE